MKKIILSPAILLILLFSSACFGAQQWMIFHDDEIKGFVVNEEDKKPIEGAIVVALWALEQVPGQGSGGYAKILVATTDKEGKFTLPTWTETRLWKFDVVMHELAPRIVIYKPGYKLYWSHRVMREGFPEDMSKTKEEKIKLKEKYGIAPTKFKKVYTDEEIWENHSEFRSRANFPDTHFLRDQLIQIFDVLQESIKKLSDSNNKSKNRLFKDIKEDREFYVGGKK